MIRSHRWIGAAALVALTTTRPAGLEAPAPPSVSLGADGKLLYSADARGNTIVDFSHAGYGGGGVALPDVPARVVVMPDGGQHRARIQAALDRVSRRPMDADGIRGAVVLDRGRYEIDTALEITASGVVLRGSGDGEDGSVIVATGTSRRTLIEITGRGVREEVAGSRRAIADAYVPVGSRTFTLENAAGFSIGDAIVVHRPSTKAWISSIGMDTFQGWRPENRLHWQPASRDITWDRIVTAMRADIATPEELERLKAQLGPAAVGSADFLNGPEFQRLFDNLWQSTRAMRTRTWHEYRDQFPELVMLQQEDEYVNIDSSKDARQ